MPESRVTKISEQVLITASAAEAQARVTKISEQVLITASAAEAQARVTKISEQVLYSEVADVRVTAVYFSVLQSVAGRLAPVCSFTYGRP